MAKFKAQKIAVDGVDGTPVGELGWLFISGDGKDNSKAKDGSKLQKQASLYLHKDSAEAKALMAAIDPIWEAYKESNPAIKKATKPDSLGYKVVKDPETDEETDMLVFQFKTNSYFPAKPGEAPQPNIIKVFDKNGSDVTAAFHASGKKLGNGTIGRLFGTAGGYDVDGNRGISLYLTGVQIGKPVWYEGTEVEATEMDGEDLDLTPAISIPTDTDSPRPDL